MSLADFGLSTALFNSVFSIVFVISLITSALYLVLYFLKATAVYKLASSKGIKKAYFAFIPVLNAIALGSLADSCAKKGRLKTSLLITEIVRLISLLALLFTMGIAFNSLIFSIDSAIMGEASTIGIGAALSFAIAYILAIIAAVVFAVQKYIALYRVYKEFAAKDAVILLIVSILINISEPIILAALKPTSEVEQNG